jgi:hypothetical protein
VHLPDLRLILGDANGALRDNIQFRSSVPLRHDSLPGLKFVHNKTFMKKRKLSEAVPRLKSVLALPVNDNIAFSVSDNKEVRGMLILLDYNVPSVVSK